MGSLVFLSALAGGITFFIYRKRRYKKKNPKTSRVVEEIKPPLKVENSFRETMKAPTAMNVPFSNVSTSRIITFLPPVEDVVSNKTPTDIFVAERQTNAMKYFSHANSTSNILRTQSIRRPVLSETDMLGRVAAASMVVEDENGRRGFTSSGVRNTIRPLSVIKKTINEEESDKPRHKSRHRSRRRVDSDSEEEVAHKSRHKSRRRIDSDSNSEEEVKHRSSRRSSSKNKSRDEPVESDNKPDMPVEVKPEPTPEETPKPKIKKSKSKTLLEAPASPVVVEVSPEKEVKVKRKKSKDSIVVPEPVPEAAPEPAEEPKPKIKKSKSKSKLDTPQ